MPKYLFAYHGGDFPQELAGSQGIAWTKWLDALGDKVIDRGGPLLATQTLASGGKAVAATGAHEITGYSIVEADSFAAALAIAKNCPQIGPPHKDGTVEIAELMEK